jgi:hypothetical protein
MKEPLSERAEALLCLRFFSDTAEQVAKKCCQGEHHNRQQLSSRAQSDPPGKDESRDPENPTNTIFR